MTDEELVGSFDRIWADLNAAAGAANAITTILWDADMPASVAIEKMRTIKLLAGRCNREATEWLKRHESDSWTVEQRPR